MDISPARLSQYQIGEAGVNDPLGPDSYGYYIYDNEDLNSYYRQLIIGLK